ncbi:LysR family transcriptional regulator [Rhodobacteraceae bacterium N5(2021)]|uniref:LysR family transcriptional regulator n=1 Tax=Gymnodinialimonas phycosphaerae TaxID=2841589 RepID=A0A975YEV1_9RHOB|nr:LysR family transcriptional regulator [Gymnodinialimonas phycosphaerae]MBY4893988.1 LysR family transcriptional regulator [Gymnodinialimonas phycosphaerae]
MDWRDIPSLSALRAFEAAARLGSLSEAARALNVTHAAIAAHVRALEAEFGQPLLRRSGRGMVPTQAGTELARDLGNGFAEIAAGVRALRQGREDRPVILTTTPSFAENWLMPCLAAFWSAHPDVPLTVQTSQKIVDLRRDGVDLAIRHGKGPWPGVDGVVLTHAKMVVVGKPGRYGPLPEDPTSAAAWEWVKGLPWLLDLSHVEFNQRLERLGVEPAGLTATALQSNALVLPACRGGVGVSAQPFALVEADIIDGRLEVLAEEIDSDYAYHLLHLPGPLSRRAQTFVTWMRRDARCIVGN